MSDHDGFAERLGVLMRALDMNAAQFARATNMTRQTIGNWLLGNSRPSESNLQKLRAAVRVNTDWLLFGCGDMFVKTKNCISEERAVYEIERTQDVAYVLPLTGLTVEQRRQVILMAENFRVQNDAVFREAR